MKRFALISLTVLCLKAAAQQSVPVFNSKDDSIQYSQVQGELNRIFSTNEKAPRNKVDSLIKLQNQLRDKIMGYKNVYHPDENFTAYEDLLNNKIDPNAIKKLSISITQTSRISSKVIRCTNLTEIELVNTSIKKLPHSLNKLKNLKSIYIYNLEAKRLKLGKNEHVKELLIQGTQGNALPKDYKKLKALEELNLANNIGLSEFPSISKNKKLKKLNLIGNQITLNSLKTSSTSLEELNLQRNKITNVPSAFGNFTMLKKVTFNYNQITDVTPDLIKLTNLEEISFYQNKLTAIPNGVYSLSRLKSIDLYHNQITKVDDEVTNLTNLEILYLANNLISSLPESLGSLSKLKELYLSNNKLFMLPKSLNQLTLLTTLRVNNNKLSDFPEFVMELPLLENLDISANSIRTIPKKITGLSTLKILVLSDNPVNPDEVNIAKIVHDLTANGTIVHQNYIKPQTNTP